MQANDKLEWKVNTPGLLREIMSNPSSSVLLQPIGIFRNMLEQVAARAIELDDPQLNILMLRLALYEQSNPEKNRGEEITAIIEQQKERIR